jgi:hypothetical protein
MTKVWYLISGKSLNLMLLIFSMKRILLSICVILSTIATHAQRTCGTMHALAAQIAADPAVQQQLNAIDAHAINYANGKKTRALVTIPVVFHIVYKTAQENITDAQCIANLAQLNEDFAHINADTANTPGPFKALAANTDIQFCLAVRDPNGNATSGITRTVTTVNSFSTNNGIKSAATGGIDGWPVASYLNIWVGNLGPSLLGYAQFPGGAAATDGVVVTYRSVGSISSPNALGGNYDMGRTLTHEVGHWLNLRHIWGDDAGACTGSDQVNDTPNMEDANYGCPSYPLLDACATALPGAMFMNYMDYVDDNCMNMFTDGQSVRMAALFATGGSRAALLNSQGCIPVAPCSGTPTAGSILSGLDTLCGGGKLLSLSGSTIGVGISYQWLSSNNSSSGYALATGPNTGSSYFANATPGVMYYKCVVTCANAPQSDTTAAFAVYTYGVNSVLGNNAVCAAGPVSLTAQGIGTMNWFTSPTATVPVFIGNPYTPTIAGNTTFYVNSASLFSLTVGPEDYFIGQRSSSNSLTNGLKFRVFSPMVIDSVFVYPNSSGNVVINIIDSATNTNAGSFTLAVTAAQVNTKVKVPVNFTCPVGTYSMNATGSTVNGLYRNTTGVTYPYTIVGTVSIVGPITSQSTNYRYFYDWHIRSGCATPKIPVPIVIAPSTVTATATNIACNGGSSTITATAAAGFTYAITGGGSNGNGVFGGQTAGTYIITATNAASCVATTSITITQPAQINLALATTNITTGTCTGSITASVTSGGVAPFTYSINGGTYSSINSFTNLCFGTYTICAKDANGCTQCSTAFVNTLNSILLTTSTVSPCAGAINGKIICNIQGGIAPYQYKLNTGLFVTSNTFPNLAAGTYTITGRDANNITASTIVVLSTTNLAITTSTTPVSVVGACNGSLTVVASGGVIPYSYTCAGSAPGPNNTFINRCIGPYNLCVIDSAGCFVCKIDTVKLLVPVSVTIPTKQQSCPGLVNGSFTALAINGTPPYTFALNGSGNYTSSSTFTGLAATIYTVNVKDANNVSASATVNLGLSANLAISSASTSVACFGECNGTITLAGFSSGSPYTYILNGVQQSSTVFNNVCSGTYTFAVKDAYNCSKSSIVTVNTPASLANVLIINNPTCNGLNNGSVTIASSGGTPNYSYAQNAGSFSGNNLFTSLGGGSYTFTTKDANNCTVSLAGTVVNPAPLFGAVITDSNNAQIIANGAGGTVPYTFAINGITQYSNNVFSNVAAGIYTISITDAKGCVYTQIVELKAPTNIKSVTLSQSIAIYPNPSNGLININIDSKSDIGLLKINVLNAVGQLLQSEIMDVHGKTGTKTLHLEHLPSATYIIQVIDEHNGMFLQRVVIQ